MRDRLPIMHHRLPHIQLPPLPAINSLSTLRSRLFPTAASSRSHSKPSRTWNPCPFVLHIANLQKLKARHTSNDQMRDRLPTMQPPPSYSAPNNFSNKFSFHSSLGWIQMVQRLGQVLNPPELETPVPFILHIETCTISKLHMLHMTKYVIICRWCITLITSNSHTSLQKKFFSLRFRLFPNADHCDQVTSKIPRESETPVAKLTRSHRRWLLRIPCNGW